MQMWQPKRQIIYEEDLSPGFVKEIEKASQCDTLAQCIQCGTCSGTCPLSIYMDYTPRRIIAMTRAGMKDDVLKSFTIWLCASCYECTVECPKSIKVTDVMYALKQRAIKDKVYPKRFVVPVLAREFFNTAMTLGRNHEGWLILMMYLKSNPFLLLKQVFLGMKLFFTGRLEILPNTIKAKRGEKGDLHTIMQAIERGGK